MGNHLREGRGNAVTFAAARQVDHDTFRTPQSLDEAVARMRACEQGLAELNRECDRRNEEFRRGVGLGGRGAYFKRLAQDRAELRDELARLRQWRDAEVERAARQAQPAQTGAGGSPTEVVVTTKAHVWDVHCRAAHAIQSMLLAGAPVTREAERFLADVAASVPAAYLRTRVDHQRQSSEQFLAWCAQAGAPAIEAATLLVGCEGSVYEVELAPPEDGVQGVTIYAEGSDAPLPESHPHFPALRDLSRRAQWRMEAQNGQERAVYLKARRLDGGKAVGE
jgi:hypothetical protein